MNRPILTVKNEPAVVNEAMAWETAHATTYDPVAAALAASMHTAPNPWGLYGLAQRQKESEQ